MSISKRFGFTCSGSARKKLKRTSPFAILLIEIGSALLREDLSNLILAIGVDRHLPRKKLSTVKHSADLLLLLYEEVHITATDTHFLEHLLEEIGRKDLKKLIQDYHKKRQETENTPPTELTTVKTVYDAPFTRLRPPVMGKELMKDVHPLMTDTPPQDQQEYEVGEMFKQFPSLPFQPTQFNRPSLEGMSLAVCSQQSEGFSPTSSPQEDGWSQMSIDSSQKSAMSISDDEKIGYRNDKLFSPDTDENSTFFP